MIRKIFRKDYDLLVFEEIDGEILAVKLKEGVDIWGDISIEQYGRTFNMSPTNNMQCVPILPPELRGLNFLISRLNEEKEVRAYIQHLFDDYYFRTPIPGDLEAYVVEAKKSYSVDSLDGENHRKIIDEIVEDFSLIGIKEEVLNHFVEVPLISGFSYPVNNSVLRSMLIGESRKSRATFVSGVSDLIVVGENNVFVVEVKYREGTKGGNNPVRRQLHYGGLFFQGSFQLDPILISCTSMGHPEGRKIRCPHKMIEDGKIKPYEE